MILSYSILVKTRLGLKTFEYWYLRWFGTVEQKIADIYNEENKQTYVLKKNKLGEWKVDVNSYPSRKNKIVRRIKRKQ